MNLPRIAANLAGSILIFGAPASAITVVSNTRTLSTTVAGNTVTTLPSHSIALPSGGTLSGAAAALTGNDLGSGSWQFNGTNLANLNLTRPNGGPVEISAQFVYTLSFTLGVGEVVNAFLDMGYTLAENGEAASLSWSLTGPGGSATSIVGSRLDPATGQSIGTQSSVLSSPGTYTFLLTGALPSTTTSGNKSASISVDSVNLSLVVVPEPGTSLLGALGISMLLMKRRRIRA